MDRNVREIIFRVILIGIAPALLVMIEFGLRLFRYGGSTDLFVTVKGQHGSYYMVNPDLGKQYFLNQDVRPYVSQDVIPLNKSDDAYRIFCLGASTTVGFPYMYNAAFPSLLKDRLTVLFPERTIEVVNLGVTAVNSYIVRDFVGKVWRYDPDLLIVYTGHNEFYGALGIGSAESAGRHPWTFRISLFLRRSRLVRLLRNGMRSLALVLRDDASDSGESLMEIMARERLITYGGRSYTVAKEYFKDNLTSVVKSSGEHGVTVILCTLVSNLRDQAPFEPIHREGLSEMEREQWQSLYDIGQKFEAEKRYSEAIGAFEAAIMIDSLRADTFFELGRCYDAVGDTADAMEAYEWARDLDGLRFRASGEFNEIIREIGKTAGAVVADLEKAFSSASPGGIVGNELLWEHVHPNFDGYMLMAKILCRIMTEHSFIASESFRHQASDKLDADYRKLSGVTDFDLEAGRLHIEVLKHRWPFRNIPERVTFNPETHAQRFAWDYTHRKIGWGEAHQKLATLYIKEKRIEEAEREIWALAKNNLESSHLLVRVADLQQNQRKFEQSIETLNRALHIEETAGVHARLGAAFLSTRRLSKAIFHLERALDPEAEWDEPLESDGVFRARFLLGEALVRTGQCEAAEKQLSHLRKLAPNSPATLTLNRHIDSMERR